MRRSSTPRASSSRPSWPPRARSSRPILRAEGSAQARILEAQGQARAIQQVFGAIHRGKPTQRLLAYQYLQVLPQLARGDSNKMWIIPSEVTDALRGISGALGGNQPRIDDEDDAWVDPGPEDDAFADTSLQDPAKALAEARGQAGQASAEATDHATPSRQRRFAAGPDQVRRPRAAPTVPTAARPPRRRRSRPSRRCRREHAAAALTDAPVGAVRSPGIG